MTESARRGSKTWSFAESGGWTAPVVISLVAMVLVQEYVALSVSMVSMAMPSITTYFATSQGGWLVTGFLLTGAVTSPLFGKMADLYGKRRILVLVLVVAAIGGVISATAPSISVLILGRCVEGVAVAGLFLSYSLMRDVYPRQILPLAASLCATGIGVFGIGVPFLVGWLLENIGFRGLFWFDAGVLVAICVIIVATTPETSLRTPAKLDLTGGLLLGGGIAAVLVAVSMGGSWGWTSVGVGLCVVAGATALTVFWFHARRIADPIVDLRLLSARPILMTTVVGALGYAAFTVYGVAFPMMAMASREESGYGLGMTPTQYALLGAPGSLAIVVGGFVVGKVVGRAGGRICLLTGCTLLAAGGLSIAFLSDSYGQYLIAVLLIGFGTGLTLAAVPNLVIENAPAEDQGSISANVQVALSALSSAAPVVLFAVLAASATVTAEGISYSAVGFRNGSLLIFGAAGFAVVLLLTVFSSRRLARSAAALDVSDASVPR
ncbi:MFS transporter [Rhodococcus sp. NPDC003322]